MMGSNNQTDFLSGFVKNLVIEREKIKSIVMSAPVSDLTRKSQDIVALNAKCESLLDSLYLFYDSVRGSGVKAERKAKAYLMSTSFKCFIQ